MTKNIVASMSAIARKAHEKGLNLKVLDINHAYESELEERYHAIFGRKHSRSCIYKNHTQITN